MLAKIWKKLLLAVCIVACLFNITYKIVHKSSLKVELQSVVNGESLSSIFKSSSDEEDKTLNNDYIDGIKDNVSKNTIEKENVYENTENYQETTKSSSYIVNYN
jgi:hypothetical protein